MKSKEIREMSEVEIEKHIRDSRDERVRLRMQKQAGKVEHPHHFKKLSHRIARLETILKEKKPASTKA